MKKYVVRESIPKAVDEQLKAYPELVRSLLYYRDIDTPEKAHEFLNPNFETGIHDPYLLKDMGKAVERILKAIEKNEKILVYSDYDADGIPGAVVMHDFFKLIGYSNFDIYIPHRHNEGFGLHLEAIELFKEQDVKLIITLDCGITDVEEVARANKLGMDVIITDHHEPGTKIPAAYAIVNPKQTGCNYPFDMLCGSGVAFKLVQGILSKKRFDVKEGGEKWLLDMVGLATLSDMVPLRGENRVLAYYGLKVLRKSRRPGLQKLVALLKMNQQHLTEDDVGFMITPRINAASRMGIPSDAFKMLSEQDEGKADVLARYLNDINQERKGLVAALTREIKKTLEERRDHYQSQHIIVLGNPAWRPALLGLAANTIAEEYSKPVFLWGREDGKYIKGSCRSDGIQDLVKIMEGAREAFLEFGGHKMSGGFSVEHDKIHSLEEALIKSRNGLTIEGGPIVEHDYIDAKINLEDVNWTIQKHLDQLAPFGIGNPKPLFLLENVTPLVVKQFGKGQEHLEMAFTNGTRQIKAIGFFMKPDDFAVVPEASKPHNLVATIEKSMFRNYPELRLRIVDII
ncbi:single-stranded-DNA-specific exonuclease RecJ [Candidatus Parcubacteria bacterium]|nr:single-stranded-DNA-specific exonuclease RecJ [Candidatus Parcubacteria bacterium]